QLALIEPYMGMSAHVVIWREDGSVFAHIHPAGTFSMAAQELFLTGKISNSPNNSQFQSGQNLGGGLGLHSIHTNATALEGRFSFPYQFPQPGKYRIWVQTRCEGRILTGAFAMQNDAGAARKERAAPAITQPTANH